MALHRWKPGESGNPLGRPKGSKNTVESYLRRYLAKGYEPDAALEIAAEKAGVDYKLINKGATIADVLAQIQIQKALRGDQEAYREVVDRTEGKPVSSVDISASVGVEVDFMQSSEVERIKAELKAAGFVLPSWMETNATGVTDSHKRIEADVEDDDEPETMEYTEGMAHYEVTVTSDQEERERYHVIADSADSAIAEVKAFTSPRTIEFTDWSARECDATEDIPGLAPGMVEVAPDEIEGKPVFRVGFVKDGTPHARYVSANNAVEAMQSVRERYSLGAITELTAELEK